MNRRRLKIAAALAAAGALNGACASDPYFWDTLALATDVATIAIALDNDCVTDIYGYAHCHTFDVRPERRGRDWPREGGKPRPR